MCDNKMKGVNSMTKIKLTKEELEDIKFLSNQYLKLQKNKGFLVLSKEFRQFINEYLTEQLRIKKGVTK